MALDCGGPLGNRHYRTVGTHREYARLSRTCGRLADRKPSTDEWCLSSRTFKSALTQELMLA